MTKVHSKGVVLDERQMNEINLFQNNNCPGVQIFLHEITFNLVRCILLKTYSVEILKYKTGLKSQFITHYPVMTGK